MKEVVKSFSEGNTIGVKFDQGDRTNADARLLPGDAFESKTVDNFVVHRAYCPDTIKAAQSATVTESQSLARM